MYIFAPVMPPEYNELLRKEAIAQLSKVWDEKEAAIAEVNHIKTKLNNLQSELEALKRLVFGQKSERYVPTDVPANQLTLGLFGETSIEVQEEPVNIQEITYTKSKPKQAAPHGRTLLPEHLPRIEVVIEPEEDTTGMKRIGEEISEVLEYKPGSLFVIRTIRPKYARLEEQGVAIAPMPERTFPKSMAGYMLLAYLIVSKFVDHLPLYRQSKMFAREGMKIPDSTIGAWITPVCNLLVPLYNEHKKEVLGSNYLQVDETTIKVQDSEKKGKTHLGYQWVCYAPIQKMVLFTYHKGRTMAAAVSILQGFKGDLQSDAYVGYSPFEKTPHITMWACLAHIRRKFYDALKNDKKRAETMLRAIGWLYDVENVARQRNATHEQRKQLRTEYSKPMLPIIKKWLDENYDPSNGSSPIQKAIAYFLRLWNKFEPYTNHGHIEIDNNLVENEMRPFALGRKNYLFAGSHEAAQHAAIIYSFMATCRANDVNPLLWLADVIERLPSTSIQDLKKLLPQNWKTQR